MIFAFDLHYLFGTGSHYAAQAVPEISMSIRLVVKY